jgi:hypothetical protein
MRVGVTELGGACKDQVKIFRDTFGASVNVTSKNIRKAVTAGLDINWPIRYLDVFAPIWAEYEKAHAPIWAEYRKAHAPIWAEYEKAHAPIWAEYSRQCGEILIGILFPPVNRNGGKG